MTPAAQLGHGQDRPVRYPRVLCAAEGARVEGDDLVVPYTKDQVKDTSGVDPDGHLEPAEENRLYEHYPLGGGDRTYTDAAISRDNAVTRHSRLPGHFGHQRRRGLLRRPGYRNHTGRRRCRDRGQGHVRPDHR